MADQELAVEYKSSRDSRIRGVFEYLIDGWTRIEIKEDDAHIAFLLLSKRNIQQLIDFLKIHYPEMMR